MNNYPKLFSPLKVNTLTLKNRIIAAPMGGGFIDAHKIESLASKAKGGAALVVIGSCNIDNDRSLIAPGWAGLYDPHMESYMDQLNVIHQYGAKASIELMHAGLWADVAHLGKNPMGPTKMIRNIGKDADNVPVDEMTIQDIETVADSFANAAVRAKKLGFDMCMLHFAHGWLPAQFLSPKFNKRKDEFGGRFENRARFPKMIVERVRNAVGKDYPIDMRISGDERCRDGIKPEEVVQFIKMIETKIDMVQVSSGIDKYMDLTTYVESPQLYPHLLNVDLAKAMRNSVNIPVITVGGITLPDEAEMVLENEKADGIALGRALLADPQWVNKARNGEAKMIVPCLRCLSCYHVATESFSHGCAVNPVFTREERVKNDLTENKPKQNIVIVGGGPAGMKAAITAAERGHNVHLYEKEAELGGLIRFAEFEKRKVDLRNYGRYLVNRVLDSNISVLLNTEATPEKVKELSPDVVIVAVGSVPSVPHIIGVDSSIVVQALDCYKDTSKIGSNVVIIGGGEVGCELGLSLAETGRKTLIVEMSDQLAGRGNLMYKEALRIMMEGQDHLSWKVGVICKEITENGIRIVTKDGDEMFIEADTIVLATGMKPLRELAESFSDIVYDVKLIGDCVRPRKIDDATYEGFFAITSL